MSDNNDKSIGMRYVNERGLFKLMLKKEATKELDNYEARKGNLMNFVKGHRGTVAAPTLKRIHVNQHNIKANAKAGNEDLPVYTIKNRGETLIATRVDVDGPSQLVYKSDDPLSCGARCWIETYAEVVFEDSEQGVTWIK